MVRLLSLGLLLFSASAVSSQDVMPVIFNGKDFAGWSFHLRSKTPEEKLEPKDTWSVVKGVIKCTGKPNGYFATVKEFGDYKLKLKWRYPEGSTGGNSGILLHVTGEDKVWPHCLEVQLNSGKAGDIWLNPNKEGAYPKVTIDATRKDETNAEGRHYFRVGKDEMVEKPIGEWNDCEITCKGGDITIIMNSKLVNEIKNGSLVKGRIAFQSEGTPVEFQDIQIQALKVK